MTRPIVTQDTHMVTDVNTGGSILLSQFQEITSDEFFGGSPLGLTDLIEVVNNDLGLGITLEETIEIAEDPENVNTEDVLNYILDHKSELAAGGGGSSHDNTLNWSWFGPTIDFHSFYALPEGGRLFFVRWHAGGDPRYNYLNYEAFFVGEYDADPFQSNRLEREIETDHGQIYLIAEDAEGYSWEVGSDEEGLLKNGYLTNDDLEKVLDFKGKPSKRAAKNLFESLPGLEGYRRAV